MPLFRRPDGDLVHDLAPSRYIMPFIMRDWQHASIFHEETYDITNARRWLRDFNRAQPQLPAVGLFHFFVWACGQALWRRPGLNRFVRGKRVYQRRGVQISFAAKQQMRDDAPLVTVKLSCPQGESLADCARRITESVANGRSGRAALLDKELRLAMALPAWLVAAAMALLRWLDKVNLMPAFMIENDPLYTSLFVSNLGSVGLDRTYHHLYETGTAPLFASIGAPRKAVMSGRDGREQVRDVLEVRWTLDERVNDAFYCAQSLKLLKRIIEDPVAHLGEATGAGVLAERPSRLILNPEPISVSLSAVHIASTLAARPDGEK